MKFNKKVFIIILILISLTSQIEAKIRIIIDSGSAYTKIAIAIPNFKDLGSTGNVSDFQKGAVELLKSNLTLSGYFSVIDPFTYFEDSKNEGIEKGEINFSNWKLIKTSILFKGGFKFAKGLLELKLKMYDVNSEELLLEKEYSGNLSDYRKMIHKFCDEVVKELTGEEGIFQTKIAFESNRASKYKQIYTSELDGGNLVKVTLNESINLFPAWSPDGSKIAFTAYVRTQPNLYILNLPSLTLEVFSTFKGPNIGADWSPDGRAIAFSASQDGNFHIFLKSLSGGEAKKITNEPGINVSPSFSPDGQSLVFVSDRTGAPQIYRMDKDGSKLVRLTFGHSKSTSPAWSPKGDKIAYVAPADGNYHIFTIDPNGQNIEKITDKGGDHDSPTWSPDGNYIAFSANYTGNYKIYIIHLKTKTLTRLTTGRGWDDSNPTWSPRLNF